MSSHTHRLEKSFARLVPMLRITLPHTYDQANKENLLARSAFKSDPSRENAQALARSYVFLATEGVYYPYQCLDFIATLAREHPSLDEGIYGSSALCAKGTELFAPLNLRWREIQFEKSPACSKSAIAARLREAILKSDLSRSSQNRRLLDLQAQYPHLNFQISGLSQILGWPKRAICQFLCLEEQPRETPLPPLFLNLD